ncbi:hypothetical protein ABVK25_005109 [Lepraria finkii]|uniref:Rhodopsin domain-containing protein n=1 Tax=Lepraria finkii TaxID=1340010 RepID=A0ABR4BAM8_9LECA
MIWGLSLTESRKLALSAVFGTGLFVLITTIIHEVTIVQTIENRYQIWVVAEQIMWLTLELNIGIICGCMPSLPIILRYLLSHDLVPDSIRSLLHSSSQSNSKSTPSKNSMGRYGNSNLRDDSSSDSSLKKNGMPYVDLEGKGVAGKRDEYPLKIYSVSTPEAEA